MTKSTVFRPRNPWLAALLSLMMAGLGHVYCGRIAKGLIIILVSALIGQGALITLMLGHPSWCYAASFVIWVMSGVVWLYAVVDSILCARRCPADYQLKDYNRWHIYLVLILLTVPISAAWSLVVRESHVEAFYIPVNSMYPTVCRGDRVLADKRILRFESLQRGDLIVFINPNDRGQRWIKRVAGLPGDAIEIRGGEVSVNGERLERRKAEITAVREGAEIPGGEIVWEKNGQAEHMIFLADTEEADAPEIMDFEKLTVPPGHCFVLGDNRNRSKDSRHVGAIPLVDIVGRVDYRYYPSVARLR